MNNLTIVIPVGPYHSQISAQAIASAHAQTIPCDVIVIEDMEAKGTSWARNRGIAACDTPLIAFLDADDTLDPRFAELTVGILSHYAQSHEDVRYVYTDWIGANNEVQTCSDPCEVWTNKTFHLVTSVVPTHAARLIGGFDEAMTGVEDADFYIRLRLAGFCGLHVNAPLVHYREGGQRSITVRANGDEARALMYMTNRYGGYTMGCCGDNTPGPTSPTNEPLEGDVLAQAQWHGNRREIGRSTGRLYPRVSFPHLVYMSPLDVDAAPHLWKRVQSPQQASSGVVLMPQYKPEGNWQDIGAALFGKQATQPSQPVEVRYNANVSGRSKSDVVAKAQEWTKIEGKDVK